MHEPIHATLCSEYDPIKLEEQVKAHIEIYPSFDNIEDKRILLKINLLSASDPDRAITTHPALVKALVKVLMKKGATVVIGDSPGGLFNKSALRKAYEASGMIQVAKETGCELNYNTNSHEEKHAPGKFTKKFNVCDYLRDCDLVIALPKIKTHMFCGLTCSSKVMFGVVPGTEKVRYHTRFPNTLDFSKMLLDLTDLCNVDLFLVDGIIGMDGRGPSQGSPRKVGVLISGTEHAPIDLLVTRITGLNPEKLPITKAASDLGHFSSNDELTVTGDGRDFKMERPFKPAKGGAIATNPPRFLQRIMINLATNKPIISHRKCVGCGVCKENCAGDAITIVDEKARIKYSKCIRCYCCHELCPYDAIYLTMRESGIADYIGDVFYNHFVSTKK